MFKLSKRAMPMVEAWKDVFQDKLFRWKMLIAPALFVAYSAITQPLGSYVEARRGIQLKDTMLTFFPSFDFSVPVFLLLYSSIVACILAHLHKPRVILRVLEMHLLVAIVRQLCILWFALEPPTGIIVLRDVFLENTFYPHSTPLTKDLFFSGHVASIWIYFLCAQRRYLKWYLVVATLLMSFMVLSMRIHYTYDVYGAVLITSVIYFSPAWVRKLYAYRESQRQIIPVRAKQ